MKKFIFTLGFILFLAVPSFAQASQVQWNQPETNASTFTYTLKVDTAAPLTLVATCTAGACSAPIATPTTGSHTYTLTATNSFGSTSSTIGPGAPPNTSGFKITIIIQVP
jgi:hypothetical protein